MHLPNMKYNPAKTNRMPNKARGVILPVAALIEIGPNPNTLASKKIEKPPHSTS